MVQSIPPLQFRLPKLPKPFQIRYGPINTSFASLVCPYFSKFQIRYGPINTVRGSFCKHIIFNFKSAMVQSIQKLPMKCCLGLLHFKSAMVQSIHYYRLRSQSRYIISNPLWSNQYFLLRGPQDPLKPQFQIRYGPINTKI